MSTTQCNNVYLSNMEHYAFRIVPSHGGGEGLAVAVQIVEPATLAATVHAIQNSAMTATVQIVQMQAAAVK